MYILISPPETTDEFMPRWAINVAPYSEVFGYSHFGLVFLRDPESSEYAILQPLVGGLSRLGSYPDIESFKSTLLDDPEVIRDFLKPDDIAILEESLGSLKPDEVYIPVPYPFLGGSGSLDTFDKGNVRVFLEIVGQSWGNPGGA